MTPKLIFNGHDLSQEIPGFCLLTISGREGHKRSINSIEVPQARGKEFRSAIYGTKTIKVTYVIHEIVNRKKGLLYNTLNRILSAEQGQLIFTDEPDKYWIATPSDITADSITFFCSDPLKYSVVEKPFPLESTGFRNQKFFTITNSGSVPAPVRYELKLFGESGYLGLASAAGAMEFGNRTETDRINDTRDEVVLRWDTFLTGEDSGSHHQVLRKSAVSYGDNKRRDWLTLGFGGGTGNHPYPSGWCETWKTYDVPATSAGVVANDATVSGRIWYEAGAAGQIGEMIIEALGPSDQQIARFTLTKGSAEFAATALVYVNGEEKTRYAFTPNGESPFGKGTKGAFSIDKTGKAITVRTAGENHVVHCEVADFETVPIKKVRIHFGHQPYASPQYVTHMKVTDLSVKAKGVKGSWDQRNTFFPPDKNGLSITIDGETSKFYYSNVYKPELEVIGSKWFQIPPGTHTVSVVLSNWYNASVSGKAYIREAWL